MKNKLVEAINGIKEINSSVNGSGVQESVESAEAEFFQDKMRTKIAARNYDM